MSKNGWIWVFMGFTCKIDSISNVHCLQYMLVLLDRFLITWLYSLFYFFFSNEESKINLRVMAYEPIRAHYLLILINEWERDRSGGCIGNGKLPFTLVLFCIAVIVFAIATACWVRNFKKSFDSKNTHALVINWSHFKDDSSKTFFGWVISLKF